MANNSQTQLSIANMTLAHLGMSEVANLESSSNDPKIKAINRFWEPVRDDVFSELDWSFATVTENLTQIDDYYAPEWSYGYEYTTLNVATFWYVFDQGTWNTKEEQKYEVKYDPNQGDKVILTNLDDAIAEYTYIVTDPTLWSHKFIMAFTYRLASVLALPLLNDDEKATKMLTLSSAIVSEAKRIDSYNKIKIPTAHISKYRTARGA